MGKVAISFILRIYVFHTMNFEDIQDGYHTTDLISFCGEGHIKCNLQLCIYF